MFPLPPKWMHAIVGLCIILFAFTCEQAKASTDDTPDIDSSITMQVPIALPVLNESEAKSANEKALNIYTTKVKIQNKQRIRRIVTRMIEIIAGILLVASIVYLHKRKKLKTTLLKLYKSPFGRLFYCSRFCRWDWFAMIFLFGITILFSMLAGQNAMMNGYNGKWYQNHAAPIALSIYNIGKPRNLSFEKDSKAYKFLREGAKGDLEYSSITNEEAIPRRYKEELSFYESTGIAWMIALWWKLIGHPEWTTIYILFSLYYCLIIIAAYCALRQVTGLIPSTFMGLLLSAYPVMMNQVLFGIRDGARALFCFIAIAILLYLLKGGFRWKGTIVSSIFLFVICSLSTYFRSDFTVLIPFIVIAAVFFHGKVLSNYKKKTTIVLSIILGLIVSRTLPGTPNEERFGMGHVLYIGMADHPFMDKLYYSADNYSKNIAYSDEFGFMFASGKAFRERGIINIEPYSKEYDQECRNEINALVKMYPYDFFKLALSSSIQSLYIGSRFAKRKLEWMESSPGYWLYQERAKKFYQNVPNWLYIVLFLSALLLFFGGKFYQNMFICLAFMPMSGIYMLQYNLRHYFYLLILSLLIAGFLFNRVVRISFILMKSGKKVWNLCFRKRKDYLIHCGFFACLIVLAFFILFIAYLIQTGQIKSEIKNLNIAKAEPIQYETKAVPSCIQEDAPAVELNLPGFYDNIIAQNNPEQDTFNEFLKIKFKIAETDPGKKINIFPKYENTAEQAILPLGVGGIIHSTWTCPIRLTFAVEDNTNTLFIPIYFSKTHSPFIGVEFDTSSDMIEFESVERIIETDKIRTQSAFLVPEKMEDMKYAGNMDWGKVFFGK